MGRRADRESHISAGLRAYAAAQSEVGRDFARQMGMHVTDSVAIVEILRAEQRGQPLTPARLAERIGLSSGATSILLNRVESAGHVVRRREQADRRLVTLHSRSSVHDAAERHFAPVRRRMQRLFARYSAAELDVVERFVTDLVTTVADETAVRRPGAS